MHYLEVALVEWPDGPAAGGPRLLGCISDPEVVEDICKRLAAERRRQLARLESPVRPVPDAPPEGDDA